MISGYFMDGPRMAVFSAQGSEYVMLGRFRLDKEVSEDSIADAKIRAEAEALRKHVFAQSQVTEADFIALMKELNRLTVAFETEGQASMTPAQRELYRASLHRAVHRLRNSMAVPE